MTAPPAAERPRSRRRGALPLAALLAIGCVATLWVTGAAAAVLRNAGIIAQPAAAPANDTFASATPIATDGFDGTTVGASVETGEPGVAGSDDQSVWYTWTPTDPGWADFAPDAADAPGVRVYTGAALGSLTRVDQADAGGNGTSVPALAGVTYHVQVDSASAAGEAFHIDIVQPTVGPPGNDAFAAAAPLDPAIDALAAGTGTSKLATGSTVAATAEGGEPLVEGTAASHSVWYSFTEPAPGGQVSFTPSTLSGLPGGSLRVGVWTGTDVGSLTPVTAASGGAATFTATAGTTYHVSVDGPETYFDLAGSVADLAAPDTTAPSVTCTPPTGWVTSAATIPCTAGDAGSGLASAADASFSLSIVAAPGEEADDGTSTSRSVCDTAGNCAQAGPYTGLRVDDVAPAVTCDPPPAGWSATNVTVDCQAADGGSGLHAGGDAHFSLATSVAAGTASASAAFSTHAPVCDDVGNCTAVNPPHPAQVDMVPPAVSCAALPSGWQGDDVTVACAASDGTGAGLADSKLDSFDLNTTVGAGGLDAAARTNSVSVCDTVGNCTEAGPLGPVEIDRQPPVVDCPTPSGWTRGTTVTVTCTASDTGSGLAEPTQATVTLTATIPAGTESAAAATSSVPVCDAAGNCAQAGPVGGIRLDDQAPTIVCDTPTSGWHAAPVELGCTASDAGSGMASAGDAGFDLTASRPQGTVASGVAYGSRSVCDAAGNCATTPDVGTADIDAAPPAVTCGSAPSGVSAINVVIACTATDDGSGLAQPGDASFTLQTTVAAGVHDATAQTGTVRVCDTVGNCTTAGPITADVDRSVAPPAGSPTIHLPTRVAVLAAVPTPGAGEPPVAVPVPYDVPTATGGAGQVSVSCRAAPDSSFTVGATPVGCNALDQADQFDDGWFWMQVQDEPGLAPTGPAVPGLGWRAVGTGYRSGSTVTVELDGTVIGHATADASGDVSDDFTFPASDGVGRHVLVVRGSGADGTPLLVVTPVIVGAASTTVPPTTAPPTTVPGAPTTTLPGAPTTTGSGTPTTVPVATTAPRSGSHGSSSGSGSGSASSGAGSGSAGSSSGGSGSGVAPLAPGAPQAPTGVALPPPAPKSPPHPSHHGVTASTPVHAGSSAWWLWLALAVVLVGLAGVAMAVAVHRRGAAGA